MQGVSAEVNKSLRDLHHVNRKSNSIIVLLLIPHIYKFFQDNLTYQLECFVPDFSRAISAVIDCSSIGYNCSVYRNCAELYGAGFQVSGVYSIDPDSTGAFKVYCDQTTDGGGWTIFQKRLDGSVDFFRGWKDYKQGFGNLSGEFWLGLDKIHRLTKNQCWLRVDLEDFDEKTAYAMYDSFGVANEQQKYKLVRLGQYTGKRFSLTPAG